MGLACVILLQVWLAFTKSVNWDEFFHFHHLYEFQTGTSARALQTVYLRPLTFLLEVPGSTIDRIVLARLVMLGCELAAAVALYGIARKFADRPTSLICVLAWLSAGSVHTHGFALRADPPATALALGAAWFMLARPLGTRELLVGGALLGGAGLVTLKVAFYAPLFLAIAWLQWRWTGQFAATLRRFANAAAAAFVTFGLLLMLHGIGLREPPAVASGQALNSAQGALFSEGFLPQANFLWQQCIEAPYFTLGLLAAPIVWIWRRNWRAQWPLLIGCLLPLATLLFYRNSFPYYFVFILAPAGLALLPVIEFMIAHRVRTLLTLLLVGNAGLMAYSEPRQIMAEQRRLEQGLAEIFPQSVAYVDFAGVIGDAPRVLPFLTSGWGLESYHRAGRDLIVERMAQEPVPLLIANHSILANAVTGAQGHEFLRLGDQAAVRANFIHHWGPVWVAGKRIAPSKSGILVRINVPGEYTLEGETISIGGRRIRPGDVVRLDRGSYRLESHPRVASVLRWGRHLPKPSIAPPGPILFSEF